MTMKPILEVETLEMNPIIDFEWEIGPIPLLEGKPGQVFGCGCGGSSNT